MGRREALVNVFILYMPFVIGIVVGVFISHAEVAPLGFAWFTLALYAIGLALFLVAKLSLLRRGIRFSLGSAQMLPWSRRAYRAGYALMILGLLATVSLVIAVGESAPT